MVICLDEKGYDKLCRTYGAKTNSKHQLLQTVMLLTELFFVPEGLSVCRRKWVLEKKLHRSDLL